MDIKKNIEEINSKISVAANKSQRNFKDIAIVCVTKNRTLSEICQALDSGIRNIGENKIQEAIDKLSSINAYCRERSISIKFHMIGHLQTNKVNKVVGMFNLIHSVDSLKLAQRINDTSKNMGIRSDILLEVRTSDEKSKFGLDIAEVKPLLNDICDLDYIKVRGLMTMAPLVKDKEETRPYFRKLRILRDEINNTKESQLNNRVSMDYLSMGMSQDFEVAVEEGANMLRIGTAIFEGIK